MPSETIELRGHIMDTHTLEKVLDQIMALGADYEIEAFVLGHKRNDKSYARVRIEAPDRARLENVLDLITRSGAMLARREDATLEREHHPVADATRGGRRYRVEIRAVRALTGPIEILPKRPLMALHDVPAGRRRDARRQRGQRQWPQRRRQRWQRQAMVADARMRRLPARPGPMHLVAVGHEGAEQAAGGRLHAAVHAERPRDDEDLHYFFTYVLAARRSMRGIRTARAAAKL